MSFFTQSSFNLSLGQTLNPNFTSPFFMLLKALRLNLEMHLSTVSVPHAKHTGILARCEVSVARTISHQYTSHLSTRRSNSLVRVIHVVVDWIWAFVVRTSVETDWAASSWCIVDSSVRYVISWA